MILYGKIHKWVEERGFGFMKPDTGGRDCFVHRNELLDSGLPDQLAVGTRVRVEAQRDEQGKLRADYIWLID